MGEVFTPQDQLSEFNQGLAIIYRLDNILKQLHLNSVEDNWTGYYRWLKRFYLELRPNLNEKEQKEQDIHYIKLIDNEREIRRNPKKVLASIQDFAEIWEMELRDLQQKHNLGMPRQRDARFALGGK